MIKFICMGMLLCMTTSAVLSQTTPAPTHFTSILSDAGSSSGFQAWIQPVPAKELRFQVKVLNPGGKVVTITIDNGEGDYMLLEGNRFTEKEYRRVFDLSGLDDGVYQFRIGCGKQTILSSKIKIITETTMRRITRLE